MIRKPIHLGRKKHLFIDFELVETAENVRLTVNRPVKTGEKCIVPEYPWEGHRVGAYNTVMEDEGIYKMWYLSIDNDGNRWVCYATSEDGIKWEKPMMDLVSYKGIKETNIVFPNGPIPIGPGRTGEFHSLGCVFKDENPECPSEERYKLVCNVRHKKKPPRIHRVHVFASSDGLHWKPLSDRPSFRFSDTANICFWDERIKKYIAYVRDWSPMRVVGRCEFTDLTDWGEDKIVLSYDELDPPDVDYYNSAAIKYPYAEDVYLMFPSAYYHFPEPPIGRYPNDGLLDIRFAVSRDGVFWRRPERGAYVPLGVKGEWDDSCLYMSSGIIRRGNYLFMYYTGYDFTHGAYDIKEQRFKGVISRVVQRLDGFVSLYAGEADGKVVTVPVTFEGERLELNVETSITGFVRVELQDAYGTPIPGYTMKESDAIKGNYIAKTVTWQGNPDVKSLEGTPIRIHLHMRDAKLYALQFR